MECYVQHHITREYIVTCCPGYEEQDIADTLTCVGKFVGIFNGIERFLYIIMK